MNGTANVVVSNGKEMRYNNIVRVVNLYFNVGVNMKRCRKSFDQCCGGVVWLVFVVLVIARLLPTW